MDALTWLFALVWIGIPALAIWNIYLTLRVKTLDAAIVRIWNRYVLDQAAAGDRDVGLEARHGVNWGYDNLGFPLTERPADGRFTHHGPVPHDKQ